MSKICPNCATQNRDQGKFCVSCGTTLPVGQSATEIYRPAPQPAPQAVTKPKQRSALWFIIPIIALLGVIGAVGWVLLTGGDEPAAASVDREATAEAREDERATEEAEEEAEAAVVDEATEVVEAVVDVVDDDSAESTPEPIVEEPTPEPTTPANLLFEENGLRVFRERSAETGIRIELRYADGSPKINSQAGIFTQTTDVSGNTTYDERIASNRTDQTGAVFFGLNEGNYAIGLGDLLGGPWGNPFDYEVVAGNVTVVSLTLGELVVGVRNADEQPLQGFYTAVHEQVADVNGNPTRGDRMIQTRTDNTGTVAYAVVPGTYAVAVGDIIGQPWGSELNHVVESGKTTQVIVTLGRVTVGVENAVGEPVAGRYVAILHQVADVQGNPAKGDRIVQGRTDERGIARWDITEGTYAVAIGDIIGELWGTETDYVVTSGEETTVLLTLGRLRVGLQDVDGNPIERQYVEVYHRQADVNGNSVAGDRIITGYTDNRGLIEWDITAGTYIVVAGDSGTVLDVGVEKGKIAFVDGTRWEIRDE